MENHFDETHLAFVHTFGGSHNNLGRAYQLPEMDIYETDYGMVRETQVPGSKLRKTLYMLPNIMRILIPTFNDIAEIGGWRDTYIIVVPTDDANHRVYFTQNLHVDDADLGAYHDMHARFAEKIAAAPSITQLTHEILAGKGHINDYLDHPYLLLLEDAITQGGQGQIVDRSLELLGRTDAGVAAMRRVWDREIRALADGKPTKDWVYKGEEPELGF
jgi:5,5'-dehydrodivanillate O-demethylase